MKTIKLALISILSIHLNSYAQFDKTVISAKDLSYELHGMYTHPVFKEKLNDVKTLSDLIAGYPSNWIKSYVSVEVLTIHDGKSIKIDGANDVLNKEQKNMLKTAEIGTDVIINAIYKSKNAVSNAIETSKMSYSFTIIPDVEAEFESGKKAALKYIETRGEEIIPSKISKDFRVTFAFTINEEGQMINVKITKSSTDTKIDRELLEAITKLAKWTPAKNAKGIKIKQDFILTIGNYGC